MDKLEAWTMAEALVKPIVEEHGIKQLPSGGGMFAPNKPDIEQTPVAQHILHVINLAEWLREED